jgi:galactokinase
MQSTHILTPFEEHAHLAAQNFQRLTGRDSTHIVYAPGRVNLIGEHTDYNGGFVLPCAIERGIFVAARPRTDSQVRIWSLEQENEPASFDLSISLQAGAPAWSNYVRGVIAGLEEEDIRLSGFDALIHASLPAGGGLSSSAALEVATATLGELVAGVTIDPLKKALVCQKAEHVFAGTPCGIMDQFAVVFGKRGHLLLIDCRSMDRELVAMREGEVSLLIINTMVKHSLSDGGYKTRRDECNEVAQLLGVKLLREATPQAVDEARARLPEVLFRRARHITTENQRTLMAVDALRRGAWTELGQLMYGSHLSLRDDFNVSCRELDIVVDEARALEGKGVFGCRMTGGGFGGCCIALVDSAHATEIEAAISAGYRKATGIEPLIFETQPGDGPLVILKP